MIDYCDFCSEPQYNGDGKYTNEIEVCDECGEVIELCDRCAADPIRSDPMTWACDCDPQTRHATRTPDFLEELRKMLLDRDATRTPDFLEELRKM